MYLPRIVAVSFVVALSFVAAGCDNAILHETRTTNSPDVPGSAVRVTTENGAIAVRAGGPKSVAVKGVSIEADVFATTAARASAVKIVADRDAAGALSIRAEWPDGRREPSEGCSFQVDVPVTTSSVAATSVNGAIGVDGRCGSVTVRTGNGAVEIRGASGAVDAKSSNGAVTATLDDVCPGPANLETSNGAIRLVVGAGFRGNLTAETSNGDVDVEVPDAKTGAPKHVMAKRVEAVFGAGGEPSRLKTSNGAIIVEAKKK